MKNIINSVFRNIKYVFFWWRKNIQITHFSVNLLTIPQWASKSSVSFVELPKAQPAV